MVCLNAVLRYLDIRDYIWIYESEQDTSILTPRYHNSQLPPAPPVEGKTANGRHREGKGNAKVDQTKKRLGNVNLKAPNVTCIRKKSTNYCSIYCLKLSGYLLTFHISTMEQEMKIGSFSFSKISNIRYLLAIPDVIYTLSISSSNHRRCRFRYYFILLYCLTLYRILCINVLIKQSDQRYQPRRKWITPETITISTHRSLAIDN